MWPLLFTLRWCSFLSVCSSPPFFIISLSLTNPNCWSKQRDISTGQRCPFSLCSLKDERNRSHWSWHISGNFLRCHFECKDNLKDESTCAKKTVRKRQSAIYMCSHLRIRQRDVRLRFTSAAQRRLYKRAVRKTVTVIGILQSKGVSTVPACCQVELYLDRPFHCCVCQA